MTGSPSAPRFRAYFEHAEGRPVLHMHREDWTALQVGEQPRLINVEETPMAGVSSNASVVATYARQYSTATSQVALVRYDPKDSPEPYNVDNYMVWEDLPSHSSFTSMVQGASTEDNANLRSYLRENVFLVKLPPDPDSHHLGELPACAEVLFQ